MTGNAGNPGLPRAAATPNQHAPLTTLLTEQDTAALLRVSVKALQGWRYRGAGPRFVKVGRCVRYRPEDLQTFVLAALRTSTSDPGPAFPDRPGIRVQPRFEHTGRALVRGEAARPPAQYAARRRPPTRRRHGAPHIRIRGGPAS
jgi:Helix-turn-helix domain